ncbi:MAG: radical SAM protein [Acidobacteriota bacterium]
MEALLSLQRNVDSFKNYLLNIWGEEKPLCKLFSTDKDNYLYDTGTNKILKCEKYEFELLMNLIDLDINSSIDKFLSTNSESVLKKAISIIEKMMKNENILKITKIDSFGLSPNFNDVKKHIDNKLGMMQLEITDNCNLRCKYCVYNDNYNLQRNHRNNNMSIEIIKKSIEFLKSHSKEKDNLSISFYGGEPLLKFELITKAVEYAKKTLRDKKLSFSITTNATLINRNIANYLYNNNFSVVVSLDGPKKIHDLYRRDKRNNGSFKRTVLGFKLLCDSFKNELARLGISMVYSPPYSEEKIERIANFLSSTEWIPKDIRINATYPSPGTVPKEMFNNENEINIIDYSLLNWSRKRFINDYRKNIKSHPLANSLIEKSLVKIVKSPVIDHPINMAFLNGCCIPGGRKLYVTATGKFKVCERIGNTAPNVGNIYEGIDYDTIRKYYIDEYSKGSINQCSKCWLVRMCDICYQQAFISNQFNIERKNIDCYLKKITKMKILQLYCKLLELNSKGLDYLETREVV